MLSIQAYGLNDAYTRIGQTFRSGVKPKKRSVGRNHATDNSVDVLHNVCIEITNPQQRLIFDSQRKANPFAKLYETIWILSGSNEVTNLSFFLKRAKQWADDGTHWRAGYGLRMRWFNGLQENGMFSTVDQLHYVYDELQRDPSSRRAVISLWDPVKESTVTESKDFPCSGYLVFYIDDGQLHCNFTQRSCDFLWGYSHINVYEWTVVQEVLAKALNCSVGSFFHNIVNLHMYESYLDRLACCDHSMPCDKVSRLNHLKFSRKFTSKTYASILLHCVDTMMDKTGFTLRDVRDGKFDQPLLNVPTEDREIIIYLMVYVAVKNMEQAGVSKEEIVKQLFDVYAILQMTDMKVVCHNFFARRFKKQIPATDMLTSFEMCNSSGDHNGRR